MASIFSPLFCMPAHSRLKKFVRPVKVLKNKIVLSPATGLIVGLALAPNKQSYCSECVAGIMGKIIENNKLKDYPVKMKLLFRKRARDDSH